ncbi:MAG TPA: hypothetical protein VHO69_15640 [Phototrophicaceae bacterium]|nr:hypothetical protein [Phototrophicaceae bacterium]
MSNDTILVQLTDPLWTAQAVHLASALARNTYAQLIFLRLIGVRHLSYLGSELGDTPISRQEYDQLREYTATAEDYGLEPVVYAMQATSPLAAVAEAAFHLDVKTIFAQVPASRIPYWQQFQTWRLEQRLSPRALYTLTQPAGVIPATPQIVVKTPARVKP